MGFSHEVLRARESRVVVPVPDGGGDGAAAGQGVGGVRTPASGALEAPPSEGLLRRWAPTVSQVPRDAPGLCRPVRGHGLSCPGARPDGPGSRARIPGSSAAGTPRHPPACPELAPRFWGEGYVVWCFLCFGH